MSFRTDEATTRAPFPDSSTGPRASMRTIRGSRSKLPNSTLVPAVLERRPDLQLWRRFCTGETPLRPFEFKRYDDDGEFKTAEGEPL